ncbi:serine/threonine protein phosphatase 2A 55 kDa regulatory subunit B beta isoform isoform X3 [Selaginella moellendorffii]|uniref:serine/threonine protein phosphatase 2A 55 kDa regulatory subunit B beta isoform isoform X3 n=1 Tax=Selaginella moellendorffii TaxID=88036 RepID=UPI000D1C85E4|nr:serine/threonine protein phosphatase 2A 55 kDa regulatory subunit B beta isoform isoform X3 [Selaginella moellendorffii]|eukprot:XP_024519655.1 serine/threonine protein phosphatase 2A 55 kDa regulatory subunit B beta isoform isoform X3 [Selaginella moellendorffii]
MISVGSANGAPGGGQGHSGESASLAWNFSQVFGERMSGEEIQEVDIISAIEFDKTGDHLATGDRGGRVVLFDRSDDKELKNRKELEKADHSIPRHPEYRYSTEFQSHEPEFDYLKSLEIEEKINKIRWCHTANGARFVLSTNDKTIKLWKITEKKVKRVTKLNVETPEPLGPKKASLIHNVAQNFEIPPGGIPSLHLPKVSCTETAPFARCRRVYANAHTYHINSISNNSDCETYISADDLRINLWNMEISDLSFNIVDIKPANMEDLTEVITSAEFHPSHCNTLAYSSSKGTIRLIDMRQSALCDRHAILFEEQEAPATRSFFTEIVASISDIKFSRSGRYILSRDYMTLKLWDVNMNASPVVSFKVHEYLRPKLCDLYENDSLFDKFECCLSGDGLRVATGSYSNLFRVFGVTPGSDEATTLECTKTPNRRQAQTPSRFSRFPALSRGRRRGEENGGSGAASGSEMNGSYDFSSKLLHLAWHPCANLIACAASNSLYMYYA